MRKFGDIIAGVFQWAGVAVVLIAGFLTGCKIPKPIPRFIPVAKASYVPSPVPERTPPQSRIEEISIGDLRSAYQDNPISARSWLEGKVCEVHGQIFGLKPGPDDTWSVAIEDPNAIKNRFVMFTFDQGKSSVAQNLHVRENVKCTGTIDSDEDAPDGWSFNGLTIDPE
jgi:hypothetical protein